MNEILELRKTKREVQNQYKINLEVPNINQVTFQAKIVSWTKNWETDSCKCPVCQR